MGRNGHAERSRLAAHIAELVASSGLNVAVAESLTGGMVASALAEAPGSSTWFRGAVVVRRLLGAEVAVAMTGAGGPSGQDGQPPGTVFLALSDGARIQVESRYFDDDDPAEVCARTAAEALRMLLNYLSRLQRQTYTERSIGHDGSGRRCSV